MLRAREPTAMRRRVIGTQKPQPSEATMPNACHHDLPLQAPAPEAEGRRAEGAGDRAGKKIAAWEDDPMIGTATFVMLIAATTVADNAYPPCTQQRTDNCSAQQQAPGPTLYIPCPKGEYCPPHDIPRPKKQR